MKHTTMTGTAIAALAALALSACGSGGGDSGGSTVNVAILDAATGLNQTNGIELRRGTEMAIKQINAAGGFKVGDKTYKLKGEFTDLQSDPGVAASTAQKVISKGARFILGSTTSTLAGPIASAVVRANGKVLMMAPVTVLDTFAGKDAPIFRTLPSDKLTAEQYIPVLKEQFPEVKKIASLFPNDPIGKGILEIYGPQFEQAGIDTASEGTFAPDESNFVPVIQRSSRDAQAFFVGYVDTQVASVIKASVEAGRAKTFFTRGTLCTQGLENQDKIDALTCIIYSADPFNESNDAKVKKYFEDYKAEYNTEPTSDSAQSLYVYDYVSLLVRAMQKAGTVTDVRKIQEALKGLTYEGVLTVGFDSQGLNSSPIHVGIVKKDSYEVLPGKTS